MPVCNPTTRTPAHALAGQEVLAALSSAGAVPIAFNPVTANNVAKLLLRVAAQEGLVLAPAVALGLAEAADGDVRNALQSLQMAAALQRAQLRGEPDAGAGGGADVGPAAVGVKKVRGWGVEAWGTPTS